MSDYEFWQQIKKAGQVSYDWWYPTIALPAFILSLSVIVLTGFAARKYKRLQNRFFMLFLATVPAILTFPAVYGALSLRPALARIGFALPDNVNDFANHDAVRLGQYLNAFGLWALIGATLTLPMFISGFYNTDIPVLSPIVRSATKTITAIATRAFGRRNNGGRLNAPYGMLTFKRGSRSGSIEAIRPDATIGSKGDIQVHDPIVSRTHAKFIVTGKDVALLDIGSRNGTYIVRPDEQITLDGQPVGLRSGDVLYLGDPDQAESVEILYERPEGV